MELIRKRKEQVKLILQIKFFLFFFKFYFLAVSLKLLINAAKKRAHSNSGLVDTTDTESSQTILENEQNIISADEENLAERP